MGQGAGIAAKFTRGKFTWVTERGGAPERWIVASCGVHSVVYNFRKVKARGDGAGGRPVARVRGVRAREEGRERRRERVRAREVHPGHVEAASGDRDDARGGVNDFRKYIRGDAFSFLFFDGGGVAS
eukprot:29261-Pelagococcus_subviridis.AAC.3